MGKSNNDTVKDSKAGLTANILVAVLYIAAGVTMLVVDTTIISTIVYSFLVLSIGILFICFGAYNMMKYFLRQEFKKVSNYGFTLGVILIIIGAVMIFMAAELSVFIDTIVCLAGIVLGAVMLQQSFALFYVERKVWFLCLLFAALTIGFSVYFLLTNQKFFDGNTVSCVYLISAGSISLLCLIIMAIGLKKHSKISDKNYKRNIEEAPSKSDLDDSIFEEESKAVGAQVVDATDNTPGDDSLFEE